MENKEILTAEATEVVEEIVNEVPKKKFTISGKAKKGLIIGAAATAVLGLITKLVINGRKSSEEECECEDSDDVDLVEVDTVEVETTEE